MEPEPGPDRGQQGHVPGSVDDGVLRGRVRGRACDRFRGPCSSRGRHPYAVGTSARRKKDRANRYVLDKGRHRLELALRHGAHRAGTQIVPVDPAHTSQTCHRRTHPGPKNRRSRAVFAPTMRFGVCPSVRAGAPLPPLGTSAENRDRDDTGTRIRTTGGPDLPLCRPLTCLNSAASHPYVPLCELMCCPYMM